MRTTRTSPAAVSETFDLRLSQSTMLSNIAAPVSLWSRQRVFQRQSPFFAMDAYDKSGSRPSSLDTGQFPRYSRRLDDSDIDEPGTNIQNPEYPDFVPQWTVRALHDGGSHFHDGHLDAIDGANLGHDHADRQGRHARHGHICRKHSHRGAFVDWRRLRRSSRQTRHPARDPGGADSFRPLGRLACGHRTNPHLAHHPGGVFPGDLDRL